MKAFPNDEEFKFLVFVVLLCCRSAVFVFLSPLAFPNDEELAFACVCCVVLCFVVLLCCGICFPLTVLFSHGLVMFVPAV